MRILKEPKNSLVDQYRHLFATWGVTLDLSDDALHAIARKVIARKTGARGLKMVMEEILKEAMYSAPGSTVRKVVVDGALAVTEEHSE